jgi:Ferritin-like domain
MVVVRANFSNRGESRIMDKTNSGTNRPVNRRSFLKNGVLAGGAVAIGAGLMGAEKLALGQGSGTSLSAGDIAILQFVAAAELIETDLWQQYAELGGVTQGDQNNYQLALQYLDGDGSQYITSNTLDELSHATFLNAYLESKGADPVNLDQFRTLPSSQATGAQNIGRLTNLMHLNVDTSWYIRYRSATNPDFGAAYPQAIVINNRPAIPVTDADFNPPNHIQAIADTAAFHFAMIEQGGSSLYQALAQKVSSLEVLKIMMAIGGDEVAHFLEWVDFAGNAVSGPPFNYVGSQTPVTDKGLMFPDFNAKGPLFQTNLIFPVPCEFISPSLPHCAVIRPTSDKFGGAQAAVHALTNDGLFTGQSKAFFQAVTQLAVAADAAVREL